MGCRNVTKADLESVFPPTPGCQGCEDSHRYHHTKACLERKEKWDKRGKGAVNAPSVSQGLPAVVEFKKGSLRRRM